MSALYQKCFVIVSDIPGDPGVLIHNVVISEFDAGRELARQTDLPEHLRVNLRSLPATLAFNFEPVGKEASL